MNIAFIGSAGAGKGTHSKILVPKFRLLHIATGDLFRESLVNQTALGILARTYMNQGELVPDQLVDAMIEEWVRKAEPDQGLLFDGFPRTTYQAQFLDNLFKEIDRNLDAVVFLQVSDSTVERRMSGRSICRICRTPFHAEYRPFEKCPYEKCQGEHLHQRKYYKPVTVRQQIFHQVTAPVIEYYINQGKLIVIDGEGDINQIEQQLDDVFEAVHKRSRFNTPRRQLQALIDAITPRPTAKSVPGKALDVVLIGAPGSGKGTQAEKINAEFKLQHVATGDLFRENLKAQSELGKMAKSYMDRGELVPDDLTEAMVQERLSRPDADSGFLLDGFPRNLSQAVALNQILQQMNRQLAAVIYINVSDEQIIRRLSGRIICRECQAPFHHVFNPFKICPHSKCNGEFLYQRSDDNPDTVKNRLKTFSGQTAPVVDYYREAGLLIEIEGEGSMDGVTERVLQAIRKIRLTA